MAKTYMYVEGSFKRQVSKHKPRASFRNGARLLFRKHLSQQNRSIIWVHKERHAEIERLADATGLTMATVADTLLRFGLANAVVIDDEGKDVELKEYLDRLMGVEMVDKETIDAIDSPIDGQVEQIKDATYGDVVE